MRCDICRAQQFDYERGELSASERAAVEQHLQGCGACRQRYAEAARLRALLPPAEPAAPRRDVWPRLAGRIAALEAERRQRAHFTPRRLVRPGIALATVGAAAALVLTLMGGAPRALEGTGGSEALVENSESGIVWNDPWAGDVAQALDWVLSDQT